MISVGRKLSSWNRPYETTTQTCSPREIASGSTFLFLEMAEHGGHMGFIAFNKDNGYWDETRSVTFVEEVCCV